MPGIFDVLAANGILNSLFGNQAQASPRLPSTLDTGDDKQRMLNRQEAILSGQGSVTNPAVPVPMIIQAMQNGGVPQAPRTMTQDVVNDMDTSSQPMNVSAPAKSSGDENMDKYGWADALVDAGRGLMIAGSPDPAKASALFADAWANERAARKPKITPVQGGAFSMVTYPNGKTDFIRNDQVAQFISDQNDVKRMFEFLKINARADADVNAAARKEAGKEVVKSAGDTAQTGLAVNELEDIAKSLEKTDTATGPVIGLVPKWGRDIVTPAGADLQDRAERIIQASLRQTLGAQFTEKEGTRFLERAYNPRLDEKTNAARLRQVAKELNDIQANKDAALDYMKRKGTLDGFVPPQSSMPGRTSGNDGSSSGSTGGPARVSSEAEWANLPSGTQYIGPDGKTRTKR